jgi:hypothetical protein
VWACPAIASATAGLWLKILAVLSHFFEEDVMASDVYYQLREQLDQYSVGFPSTESGVEIKILEHLFTEEEAQMYLNLSMMLETPEAVADRLKQDPEKVGRLLEQMAEKGLLFRLRKEGSARYGVAPYVVGIFEYQLKSMDQELAKLHEQYFEETFAHDMSEKTLPMRTIPVNKSLNVSWPVAPYEDVREIIKSKEKIAVANCICRVQQGRLDQDCDKPLEACFMFGSHAKYYVEKGMGRWISQEESLEILDCCEEAGLVPMPRIQGGCVTAVGTAAVYSDPSRSFRGLPRGWCPTITQRWMLICVLRVKRVWSVARWRPSPWGLVRWRSWTWIVASAAACV